MLLMYVDVEQKSLDEIYPFVTFAYNTSKQESTGFTPFYLFYGREAEKTLDTTGIKTVRSSVNTPSSVMILNTV